MKLLSLTYLTWNVALMIIIKVHATTVCDTTLKAFTLYNGDTDKSTIQNIKGGQKICTPGYQVNFEAFYGPCASNSKNPIKKVFMALCKVEGNCITNTESQAGYFMFGNEGSKIQGKPIENGAYILIAKAYNGTTWTKRTDVEFTVGPCTRYLRSATDK